MVTIDSSVSVDPEMFDVTFEGNIIIASSQVVIEWHADIVVKAVIVRHTDPSARSSQKSFSFVIVQLQPIGWLKTSVIK